MEEGAGKITVYSAGHTHNHLSDWVLWTPNSEMNPFQERRGRRDHDGASQHDKDEGRVLIPEDKSIIHSVVLFVSPVAW